MPNQNLPPFIPPARVVAVPGGDPTADDFQKANTDRTPVDVSRAPQSSFIGADSLEFQPSPADIIGDMSHAPILGNPKNIRPRSAIALTKRPAT